MSDGGYDVGYRACPCYWGVHPGSLILRLLAAVPSVHGLAVLDAGCGEGKNSYFLKEIGAQVFSFDVSLLAIANGRSHWARSREPHVFCADATMLPIRSTAFDIVVAYGLLHCLRDERTVLAVLRTLQTNTKSGGYVLLCAFNNRHQDLRAHPGFSPCLLPHQTFIHAFDGWELLYSSDLDLHESHPDTAIPHTHSMTRLLARKA